MLSFTRFNRDTSILLLFATTWALAARLQLPDLQNSLVSVMAGIYTQCIQNRHEYPADAHVDHAFRHLRADVGPGSHAEALLICFIGRTAPMISALIKQLKLYRFDKEIRERVLFEARSFAPDPLQYNITRFQVDIAYPPQYTPVEIQHASLLDGPFGFIPVLEKHEAHSADRIAEVKEASPTNCAPYGLPYAETVSSQDTLYGFKSTPAKDTKTLFEPQAPSASSVKEMNFVGIPSPLQKLRYLDLMPVVPAPDLTVFLTEASDPSRLQSTPMPQFPNTAATAAANAALHHPPPSSPPPRSAAPIAPTLAEQIRESLPAEFSCSVRIERANSVIGERLQPEVPLVAWTQSEAQAQPQPQERPEVRAEPVVPANGDREQDRSLQLPSTRQEQRAAPNRAESTTERTSWLRHIFGRRPQSAVPEPRSPPSRRTNLRTPRPPVYSEGGTWAYARTCSNRRCHAPAWPSNNDDDSRLPPSRPQHQLALPSRPDEGDDRRISERSPPHPPRGSGDGGAGRPRRSLSACRGGERETWVGSRKKGSRTGFALMSFNKRRYDE